MNITAIEDEAVAELIVQREEENLQREAEQRLEQNKPKELLRMRG